MKIVYSGGGTLGPVTPLLAMHEMIKEAHPDVQALWIGTKRGPERELVEAAGIEYFTLSAGKFRRYVSFWNVIDIIRITIGYLQSVRFLWKHQPDMCISAGGFISVPLHFAAWLLGIPTWVHQQDVQVGLANKLMAPIAKKITTAMEASQKHFKKKKTVWLGNPIRNDLFQGNKERAKTLFNLRSDLPVVFATGGGTGSQRVNQMIVEAAQHLEGKCQVIHLSGKERPQELIAPAKRQLPDYHPYQFFTYEMKDAYAVADIVVSRGGFGTITELAALSKAAIFVPKPGHQEENISVLSDVDAAVFLDERTNDGIHLAKTIEDLLNNSGKRHAMGEQLHSLLPPAKKENVVEICEDLLKV